MKMKHKNLKGIVEQLKKLNVKAKIIKVNKNHLPLIEMPNI
ncbi:hypothetical protein O0B38_10435 [Staphylococcus pseudintermedius]|nr:hypothetical protein [Staphylococcus pseudintermedius]MDK3665642.1 hypothetical protein [Staphylococcus pseudintermedius]MDK4044379.1 hypothetical protein [Staphylococcus pseudintermedius]